MFVSFVVFVPFVAKGFVPFVASLRARRGFRR
jgi:hypothetical protein